ncbi:MAG: hypothetical protein ACI9XP_001219, partial [Lentimonas sp.]
CGHKGTQSFIVIKPFLKKKLTYFSTNLPQPVSQ